MQTSSECLPEQCIKKCISPLFCLHFLLSFLFLISSFFFHSYNLLHFLSFTSYFFLTLLRLLLLPFSSQHPLLLSLCSHPFISLLSITFLSPLSLLHILSCLSLPSHPDIPLLSYTSSSSLAVLHFPSFLFLLSHAFILLLSLLRLLSFPFSPPHSFLYFSISSSHPHLRVFLSFSLTHLPFISFPPVPSLALHILPTLFLFIHLFMSSFFLSCSLLPILSFTSSDLHSLSFSTFPPSPPLALSFSSFISISFPPFRLFPSSPPQPALLIHSLIQDSCPPLCSRYDHNLCSSKPLSYISFLYHSHLLV